MVSIITVVLSIMTIFILSKFITSPLIKMKIATEQLSEGNHDVQLHTERVDELGELANSISKLSQDLKEIKKKRNEFLASVSHELRTPLTYIKGYADIMNRPHLSKDEIAKYGSIVQEEANQLNALVRDLFQLAKIDENKFVIRRKDVNVCDVLENVIKRQQLALRGKNITLQFTCEEDITAYIDPDRIQQVLLNMVHNAEQHADEGTEIVLTAKQTEEDMIVSITDEGIGIPEEELPYLFDRLYRVEKSRSRESGGSGLGLAIAKEIVDAHDGSIDVQSELGKGTTVTVKIPRRESLA